MNTQTIPCQVVATLEGQGLSNRTLTIVSPRTGKALNFTGLTGLPSVLVDRIIAGAARGGTASFSSEELREIVRVHEFSSKPVQRVSVEELTTPAGYTFTFAKNPRRR